MNYELIYSSLITRAQGRALSCYTESHHIIPKCIGGNDASNNLVDLTPEEHYLAHQLLVKIHPNHPGLTFAAMTMTQGPRRSNKLYGWLKRRHSKNITATQTGKVYYNNGEKCIKLFPGEPIPEGFVKGRGWSPTKGTTHNRKTNHFKDTELQKEMANRRWDKARKETCERFGVETIEEVKQIILDFKSTCHPRYWLKPTQERFPFLSRVQLRDLIK